MMVAEVSTERDVRLGRPRRLFEGGYINSNPPTSSLSPDGRFFLVKPHPLPPLDRSHLNLIFNWFEELQRLVPTR